MNTKLLSIAVLFMLSNYAYSQSSSGLRKNSVFAEWHIGGRNDYGGHLSINYDRKIGKRNVTLFRVGFAPSFHSTVFHIPTIFTWVTGPEAKHHFEGGIGLSNRLEIYNGKLNYTPFTQACLMYRFESQKGLLVRTGVNALAFLYYPVNLNVGVSLGYRF